MSDQLPLNALSADSLSEVMEGFVLSSWVPGPFCLSAPWGLQVPGDVGWCYLLVEGRCHVQVDHCGEAIELTQGDLIIIQQGHAHWLADDPDSRRDALTGVLWPRHFENREPLLHGGGGASSHMRSVCFLFEKDSASPLLDVLPPFLVVRNERGRPPVYVDCMFRLIAQEASISRPGAHAIISRLVRVLLIRSIYAQATRLPAEGESWLKALVDPCIGPALALMHRRPERDWTVGSLADEVAMSRTAFAVKFVKMLGKSPFEYLTEWRMQRASVLLTKEGQAGLKEIASQVGYESAASFSKAFARWAGMAPGAYRARMRASSPQRCVPPVLA